MDAALVCIREKGADKLSLRALARDVGVSQAAPYRHFADKVALLSALASDGFERLAHSMQQWMGDIQLDPVGAFQRAGQAYVKFAQQNPETYRLMYSMKAADFNDNEMAACHTLAFNLLEQTVEAGLKNGVFKTAAKEAIVLAAWSMAHGYAQLVIDGIIELADIPTELHFRSLAEIMNQGVISHNAL